jgi:hypothetical protein
VAYLTLAHRVRIRLELLTRRFRPIRLAAEERAEITKARELYLRSDKKLRNAGITERAELRFTHAGVRGIEGRVEVTWVANELGHTVADLAVEYADQTLDTHLLGVRFTGPLTVERCHTADWRVSAQRDVEPPRQLQRMGKDVSVPVEIAVGIDVRWKATHQSFEAVKLFSHRDAHVDSSLTLEL